MENKFEGIAKKGEIRNPFGRPKGTLNKNNKDIRDAYAKLISDKVPKFGEWIDTIAEDNPEKALRLLIELSPYVIPRLANQTVTIEDTEGSDIDYTKLNDTEITMLIELFNKAKE